MGGATPLLSGEEKIGEIMSAPFSQNGDPCGAVRLSDASLAQTAYSLSDGVLWLPGHVSTVGVNMTLLGDLGRTGLHHRDITGPAPVGHSTKQPLARRRRIRHYGVIVLRMKPGWSVRMILSLLSDKGWKQKPKHFGKPPVVPSLILISGSTLNHWGLRSLSGRV